MRISFPQQTNPRIETGPYDAKLAEARRTEQALAELAQYFGTAYDQKEIVTHDKIAKRVVEKLASFGYTTSPLKITRQMITILKDAWGGLFDIPLNDVPLAQYVQRVMSSAKSRTKSNGYGISVTDFQRALAASPNGFSPAVSAGDTKSPAAPQNYAYLAREKGARDVTGYFVSVSADKGITEEKIVSRIVKELGPSAATVIDEAGINTLVQKWGYLFYYPYPTTARELALKILYAIKVIAPGQAAGVSENAVSAAQFNFALHYMAGRFQY